jgi:hypothetical protein
MLETEFIRSLQSNYERIHLADKPDEQRYQYCILTRGGIRGLLPCSLRYINGQVYLYYDITSRQNVAQLYGKQVIDRNWVRDFFWSYEEVRQELGRFLLDEKNILVYPEQIFQDLSNRNFFFLYLPYNEESDGFMQFFEFLLAQMDYEDDVLVQCIYNMYEKYEKMGEVYLQAQIFEDVKELEKQEKPDGEIWTEDFVEVQKDDASCGVEQVTAAAGREELRAEKKSFFGRLGGRKKKYEEQKNSYRDSMLAAMEGRAVAEDAAYVEEDYGRTIYVEQSQETEVIHKLYTPDGRIASIIEKEMITIGKQKDEVDVVLEDDSVSRIHARIFADNEIVYLEDLNSTNGTFKNGLRLQPYEKRRLEEGDEIRFGKLLFVYR